MTDDERKLLEDAQDQLRTYHVGTKEQATSLRLDLEFWDGSCHVEQVSTRNEAWAAIGYYDSRADIKSAWIDGEPLFGDCTRMDIP